METCILLAKNQFIYCKMYFNQSKTRFYVKLKPNGLFTATNITSTFNSNIQEAFKCMKWTVSVKVFMHLLNCYYCRELFHEQLLISKIKAKLTIFLLFILLLAQSNSKVSFFIQQSIRMCESFVFEFFLRNFPWFQLVFYNWLK